MTGISVYSIPSLVSALFLFSLGCVTLVSTGRDRLWRVFAGFCFVMGMSSVFGFLTESTLEAGRCFTFARLMVFFAMVSLSFANFYGIELTGFRFGMVARHRIVVRTGISVVVAIWAVTLLLLFATDWVISDVEILRPHGVKLTYGSVMWWLLGLYFVGTIRNLVFLLDAYRKAKDPAFKEFVGLNTLAFHTIFAPAIWLLFVLPVFGLPTQVLAFLAFPVSVMIFYVAIVRYQVARVKDLNVSLEQKVEERTRELKQTQARLAQSERMASLGQLVAGVAHEMNNPVAAVRSMAASVTTATRKLKASLSAGELNTERLQPVLKTIENAGNVIDEGTRRITRVVNDLKSFAKLDESELQRSNINKELEDTVELLSHVMQPGVAVNTDLGNVPDIVCYPAQLNQVFLNLLLNANEAIDGEGVITLETRCREDKVRATVRDTGHGIAAGDIDRVMEPGFTTKGRGVGTGLGLAICYQIIRDHGGEITVDSAAGEGTSVTVELPLEGPGPKT
jgi:signal transduction histidine kinase